MPRKSTKSRTPDDIRQTALRMRESEHAWLTEEAKGHRTTLNTEIMWRLSRTRNDDIATMERMAKQDLYAALEALGNELRWKLKPFLVDADERALYGDLVFTTRRIVDEVSAALAAGQLEGRTGQRLRAMIDTFHLARRALEIRFGERVISEGSPEFQDRAEARLKEAAAETPSNKEAST
jgi:hypothetical protein